jgi:pyruvate dehydrogenase E2 component (dihydrolipoamide acetyltransferase)
VSSADVAEILVSEGDAIASDQIVMELETEKAVVELRCPHAGRLESLLVKPGDTINVGQPLMKIAEGAGAESKGDKKGGSGSSGQKAAEKAPEKNEASAKTTEKAQKNDEPAESGGVVDFPLPSIGEGVTQADVAELLVKPGDVIQADQVVAELETEKAVVELRCPHAGKITAVHVKAGDTLQIGANVLSIETSAGSGQKSAPKAKKPAEESRPAKKAEPAPKAASKPVETAVRTAAQLVVPGHAAGENGSSPSRAPAPAAPSTRRLARELGVNLYEVRGTGPGGRITHEDVQSYVKDRLQALSVPGGSQSAGAVAMPGSISPPPLPDFSRYGEIERQAMSKIARVAAENLTVSWNVIPHVTQHDRADITDLEEARKRFVGGLGKSGPKVTMTAIVIKALSKCLQIFPKFNSSLDPISNEIVLKRYYNIGCAVDTEHGLVVPVVKDCHKKSILQIAADVNGLADKARDRKLPIDSMQGATCTVTNLGGIGGVGFTPIVNYPEVCILGMSRSQSELRLKDGKVEERMMMPLSLSYDHRVINGADAARFLVTLCNMLADPFQLLTTI